MHLVVLQKGLLSDIDAQKVSLPQRGGSPVNVSERKRILCLGSWLSTYRRLLLSRFMVISILIQREGKSNPERYKAGSVYL